MILSTSDIELLKMAGWCKNLPSDIHKRFGALAFRSQIIADFERLGLVYVTENQSCIRLRPKGWRLLKYLGFDYHRDAHYRSDYERRLDVASILLTFYRAGYYVFAEGSDDLAASQVFLQSPAARRDSSAGDLWGGASFYGIACVRDFVAACYFVTGNEGARLYHRNEKLMLSKASAMLRRGESQIFAGSDYLRAAKALRNQPPKDSDGKDGKQTYSQIYQDASCPLYLLECSDAGALQLLIMSREQYRKRLVAAIAKKETAPPAGIRDADGEVNLPDEPYPVPLMMAVDMDVKRIDRAFKQTMDSGYSKLILVCLEEQKKALEYLYANGDRAKVYIITPKILSDALGDLSLYEPQPAAYLDREGGVLDAAALPVHRKAGKEV